MRKHSRPMFRSVVAAVGLVAILAGCGSFGPRTLERHSTNSSNC
jgi:predicted small lipoprotein YifL